MINNVWLWKTGRRKPEQGKKTERDSVLQYVQAQGGLALEATFEIWDLEEQRGHMDICGRGETTPGKEEKVQRPWGRSSSVQKLLSVKVLVPQSCPTQLLCLWDFPARTLECISILFSRGSSQPRDQTDVSHIADRFFTIWATREIHSETPSSP